VSAQALGLEPMSCLGDQLLAFARAGKLTGVSQTQGRQCLNIQLISTKPADETEIAPPRQLDTPKKLAYSEAILGKVCRPSFRLLRRSCLVIAITPLRAADVRGGSDSDIAP